MWSICACVYLSRYVHEYHIYIYIYICCCTYVHYTTNRYRCRSRYLAIQTTVSSMTISIVSH